MTESAIRVERLSKRYQIGERESHPGLRDALSRTVSAAIRGLRNGRRPSRERRAIWALKDVSFDVERGEIVGIIGRNGAGKSTLLKILSRITEPTEGWAEVHGRIGSLLEVGTGFHPDLNGRENIYLNGAVLGMKRVEISRKFGEIVQFAEIERFIDTPVKRYSSGMYMRLAFAVAAHLEPEILLVDEVLAVGDAAFQKKCLGKMSDVAKTGRTILFVSHNLPAVRTLCQRVLLLDGGRLAEIGGPQHVIESYLGDGLGEQNQRVWTDISTAPGDEKTRIQAVRLLSGDGQPLSQAYLSRPVLVEVQYIVLKAGTILSAGISLHTQEDVHVLASPSITDSAWYQRPHPPGIYRSRCQLPAMFLNERRYYVTVLLIERGQHIIALAEKILSFDMLDLGEGRGGYFGEWPGVVRPALDWQTELLETDPSVVRN
jgi:lipopolysaccharide transport system ATP-binding protein